MPIINYAFLVISSSQVFCRMTEILKQLKNILISYFSTWVSKSFSIRGRSNAAEFKTFFLGFLILLAILQFIFNILFTPQSHIALTVIAGLHIPAIISLVIRRLHDIGAGWSGFWAFIYIIPLIGLPFLIAILFFYPSNRTQNKYGVPPN